MKCVLIIGSGFLGLNAAKVLGDKEGVEVTLIDRNNYHLFQPLLYQVATAGLSPAEIAFPIRNIFSKYRNIKVLQGEVQSINLEEKVVESELGRFEYDYLIMGCGALPNYYGNEAWKEFAPGLKTVEQALGIRRKILTAFEKAESARSTQEKKKLLTFVIIGGGPTGVELAGAIGELGRYTLAQDFKNIDLKLARVVLIEAGPKILPSFSDKLSAIATRDLESLGVQVWTMRSVTEIDENGVALGNERIESSTIIWAAGIQASETSQILSGDLDNLNRVIVKPDLSIKNHSEVFVGGDQVHFTGPDNHPLPAIASVALQQGRFIANNILRDINEEKRLEFHYIDKGQLATIGRKKAIVEIGPVKMSGFWAWLMWLFVHIYFLIGFKNKMFVLLQWTYSYFSFRKGARLIINKY